MISIVEYATLSDHIYNVNQAEIHGINIGGIGSAALMKSNTYSGWYRLIDANPSQNETYPFFAQLYVKFEQNRLVDAVIAIRGTVITNFNNDAVDAKSFLSDVIDDGGADSMPSYLAEAMHFYNMCETYLGTFFAKPPQIKLTGHSLGGAIAQLLVLQAAYAAPAIVFNSPGCGHVPGAKSDLSGYIYNVNSRFGFINKIGLTLGHLYAVDVPNLEAEAKTFFDSFDATDYNQSLAEDKAAHQAQSTVSQIADIMKGRGYRYFAYLATLDHLYDTPSQQGNQLKDAGDALTSYWQSAENAIMHSPALNLIKFGSALYAQHSMDNMLAALYLSQNLSIAMMQV